MRFIRDIYAAKRPISHPIISFEFFPPKTDEGDRNLFEKSIPALLQAKPDYCSVTYGAGGSTRDKTLRIVDRIQREHRLTALANFRPRPAALNFLRNSSSSSARPMIFPPASRAFLKAIPRARPVSTSTGDI